MAYDKQIDDLLAKPAGYYANVRPEMMERIPTDRKTILEFGCGEGVFAAALKERNQAEVWGVEIDKATGTKAAKVLDKVIISDADEALTKLPDNHFDCIIFNDVLEHLIDPYNLLKQLRSKLTDDGIIISSIPNMRYYPVLMGLLMFANWEYEDAGVLDKTHYRFFTHVTMRTMFENAGYTVVSLEGINPIEKLPLRYHLMSLITRGNFGDTRYLQYACIAKKT